MIARSVCSLRSVESWSSSKRPFILVLVKIVVLILVTRRACKRISSHATFQNVGHNNTKLNVIIILLALKWVMEAKLAAKAVSNYDVKFQGSKFYVIHVDDCCRCGWAWARQSPTVTSHVLVIDLKRLCSSSNHYPHVPFGDPKCHRCGSWQWCCRCWSWGGAKRHTCRRWKSVFFSCFVYIWFVHMIRSYHSTLPLLHQ